MLEWRKRWVLMLLQVPIRGFQFFNRKDLILQDPMIYREIIARFEVNFSSNVIAAASAAA
jgi:hypothetical protein